MIGIGIGVGFQVGKSGAATPPPEVSNLLTFTEQFDNAIWVKSGVVVVPNSILAPDASLTADTLVVDLAGSVSQASTTAAATGSNAFLGASVGTFWARFERSGTYDGTPYTFSIYLKSPFLVETSILLNRSGGFLQVTIFDNEELGPYTLHAWGAQLEAGPSATTYIPRTT